MARVKVLEIIKIELLSKKLISHNVTCRSDASGQFGLQAALFPNAPEIENLVGREQIARTDHVTVAAHASYRRQLDRIRAGLRTLEDEIFCPVRLTDSLNKVKS